ncbi:MAG: hypothetical protein O3B01_28705 [Planctomycetota bacterium]|nr:hypothetical protein [Planctomycetota bacterium]MDA1142563.1 hypothetical protein [Planctomycetota bacterium]
MPEATGDDLNIERLILAFLAEVDEPLKAREIAELLNIGSLSDISRAKINSLLYGTRLSSRVQQDASHRWSLRRIDVDVSEHAPFRDEEADAKNHVVATDNPQATPALQPAQPHVDQTHEAAPADAVLVQPVLFDDYPVAGLPEDLPNEHRLLIDLLSSMLDVPLSFEQRQFGTVERAMTQLPWDVECSIIKALDSGRPGELTVKPRWTVATQEFKDEKEGTYAEPGDFDAIRWEFKPGSSLGIPLQDTAKQHPGFGHAPNTQCLELKDFYAQYPVLFEKGINGYDTHFAERQFLETVYYPAFGWRGLSLIKPQVPFTDLNKRQRYCDFVIEGADKFAIEMEGAGFHAFGKAPTAQHNDDTIRQNALEKQGYRVIRLTKDNMDEEPGAMIDYLRERLRQDSILSEHLGGEPEYVDFAQDDYRALALFLTCMYVIPTNFRQLQLLLLHRLAVGAINSPDGCLRIHDSHPVGALLPLALQDLLNLICRVEQLYGSHLGSRLAMR